MNWEEYIINDLCYKVTDGAHYSPKEEAGGFPMASSKDMTENDFDFSNIKRISEKDYVHLVASDCKPLKDDILIIKDGNSYLKYIFVVREEIDLVILSSIAILRPNKNIIDPIFFQYTLRNPTTKKLMENFVSGAAIPRIVLKDFKQMKIEIPPLPTQRRIAAILSAYDDLIENNLKRIKLLEEAAQNIYKEWFVHFRFPGHEQCKIGENGLPQGWIRVNLFDVANIQMGYPFKAEKFNNEGIGKPAIRIRDIPYNKTSTFTTEIVDDKFQVSQGDILIGMDGFFYIDAWAGSPGYLVQRVCRIRSNRTNLNGLFLESLREPIKFYEQTISGATVAHLGVKHLKEIDIILPGKVNAHLNISFTNLLCARINLHDTNKILIEARDILLPRLMNQTFKL